jgi:hypothetical protein
MCLDRNAPEASHGQEARLSQDRPKITAEDRRQERAEDHAKEHT